MGRGIRDTHMPRLILWAFRDTGKSVRYMRGVHRTIGLPALADETRFPPARCECRLNVLDAQDAGDYYSLGVKVHIHRRNAWRGGVGQYQP